MQETTHYKQKASGLRFEFSFSDDMLVFTHEDSSGERTATISYETINLLHPTSISLKSKQLQLVAVFIIIVGLCMASAITAPQRSSPVMPLLIFVETALIMRAGRLWMRRKQKYTIFRSTTGESVRILHDKQYDVIFGELRDRRIAQLRRLYGKINLANHPAKELEKFKWLHTLGAVNDEELRAFEAQLQALLMNAPRPPLNS